MGMGLFNALSLEHDCVGCKKEDVRKKLLCICMANNSVELYIKKNYQPNLLCCYLLVSKQNECQQVISHAYLFICLIKVNYNSCSYSNFKDKKYAFNFNH